MASCITESLASALGLRLIDRRKVIGVGGKKEHNVYLATLLIPDLQMNMNGELYGVDMADGHPVLLGRDFLHNAIFIYDGKSGTFTVCN